MNKNLINTSEEKILARMAELASNYTPEWKVDLENGDVGVAVMRIFADMYMDTIHQYNQVYEKNYMSFLNLFNAHLLRPSSARCPVVFNASTGSLRPVLIKAETKLKSVNDDGEPLGFLTEGTFEVIPGEIIHQIYADYEKDNFRIFGGEDTYELFNFDLDNEQSHEMWIYHHKLFNSSLPTDWHVSIKEEGDLPLNENALKALSNKELVDWYYPTKDGWDKFDIIETALGKIILSKLKTTKVQNILDAETGEMEFCIRCVLKKGVISHFVDMNIGSVELFSIKRNTENQAETTDFYINDSSIGITEPFKPFGERYHIADQIYIGDTEHFSKSGSFIEIKFDMLYERQPVSNNKSTINWKLVMKHNEITRYDPVDVILEKVNWTYWNGSVWKNLELVERGDNLFAIPSLKERSLKFYCPNDMGIYDQLGEPRYFIRGTVDFIRNDFAHLGFYMNPIIEKIKIDYEYQNKYLIPERVSSVNNGSIHDESENLFTYNMYMRPFIPLPTDQRTLFMGMNYPLGKGPSTFLVKLNEGLSDRKSYEKIEVNYLQERRGEKHWKSIYFEDDTRGLNTSGIITLGNAINMTEETLFGRKAYWLKLNFSNEIKVKKIIDRVYVNAVWAVQKERVELENHYLDRYEQEIQLLNQPILSEEVWVNEITQINLNLIEELKETHDTKEILDKHGRVEAIWVKWKPIENINQAGPLDRVYQIDCITGVIKFGDGSKGKEMVASNESQISVDYSYGGGHKGNVKALGITSLDHSIAYIDNVHNPIGAWGGADQETISEALERVGSSLRHKHRAVTYGDMESIIRSTARDILKVKCLKNTNSKYQQEHGHVSIVVMSDQPELNLMTDQIREILMEKINECAPAQLNRRIHILDPIYVEMTIYGRITTDKPAEGRILFDQIVEKLNNFINIKTGHFNELGWNIGELPDEDMLLTVIKNISNVLKIEGLNIFLRYSDGDGIQETRLEDAKNKAAMLVSKTNFKLNIVSK